MATTLDDFIPEDCRGSVADMINYTYEYFKNHEKSEYFKIQYPIVSGANSSAFMFFSAKSNFKSRKEYELIKEEDAFLVEEYLEFTQEENSFPEIDDTIWYGSLTRDFPLGQGQAIVLQENQNDSDMIPVVGGPGTGKTTLFLSLISNIVTKRAMSNIYEGEDYNNLILVTSTSNKAVENVYKSLKKGVKHGFCYVGGNTANRVESATEVAEYIQFLEGMEFDPEKFQKYEDSVKRIVSYIEKRKIAFNEIRSYKKVLMKYDIKSYTSLAKAEEELIEKTSDMSEAELEKSLKVVNKLLAKLSTLTDLEVTFDMVMGWADNGTLVNLELTLSKLNKVGTFSKLFNGEKKVLEEADFGFKIEDKASLELIVELIHEIQENEKFTSINELKSEFEDLKILSMFSIKYAEKKKVFNSMFKEETFGEYFRTNLFSLNYKLYIQALNYMQQKTLSEKEGVIKAVGYLAETDNQYKYLVDNFGTSYTELEEFLRLLSMAYPVSTSTLAAVTNMFPGVFPNRISTYQTILADEAGMIAVNDLVPALRRADRAIVVGDPKQLSPIVSMDETFLDSLKNEYKEEFWEKFSPSCVSAFHRAAGTNVGGYKATGRGIVLDEHRRCSPQIADLFIKVAEYEGLKVCTPVPKGKAFKNIKEQGLMFFDVKNFDTNGFKKVNETEMDVIDKLLNRLQNAGYNLKKDVGIITPYKDQEVSLIRRFGERVDHNPNEEAKIGTVHKFQGVEYKVVIFSSVVSRDSDSLAFINLEPSLINVAVSRAKESFIAVGDYDKLTKDKKENYIGIMAEHMKAHGTYVSMKG
jgi:GTPase SAR1 family protein